ncbi:unnamed protein product [Mytilus coruscus]|uniref:WAP domain-containing protein n=1 Tax=Mytilus coruscus TaxID=42192 RepID=A0A6J8CA88_MYTCO|nr:unnamed protein product [Mytilus coruscus]
MAPIIKMLTFNVVTVFLFRMSVGKVIYDVDFDDDDGKWLSDDENYETSKDYLGDSVAGFVLQDNEKCPPLPEVPSSSACMATPCFKDTDCGKSEGRCCDNGCVFTCFSYPIGPTLFPTVDPNSNRHLETDCYLEKYLMEDGAKIKVRNRTCYCKQGFLTCLKD